MVEVESDVDGKKKKKTSLALSKLFHGDDKPSLEKGRHVLAILRYPKGRSAGNELGLGAYII